MIILAIFKKVLQVKESGVFTKKELRIVRENPITIYINGEEFVTLLCTPTHLKELAVGFLAAEKIITNANDIKEILVDKDKGLIWIELKVYRKIAKATYGKRYLTSGCGKGTVFYHLNDVMDIKPFPVVNKFEVETIFTLVKAVAKKTDEKGETAGGIHKAALVEDNKVQVIKSDVGRHNAVDKVFGSILLQNKEIKADMLITTGRISSEILTKSYAMGVPVVVSLSTPTALSIEIAENLNITVIGYVRGKKANIYSVPERIIL